jgi:hypothetical protein
MSKIKNENFILVSGFMVNDLKLKGNELLVYAIIYGFTQAENQVFNGSLQYLADWTNSTKQGVMKNLKTLIEKGYISKEETTINSVKFCSYHATKFNGGMQQSLMGGMQQSLPNNKDIDNISKKKSVFTPPSIEEVQAYCLERRNNVDAVRFVDFYSMKGWMVGKNPMKDWKAAVRTWERGSYEKPKTGPNGIKISDNRDDLDDEISKILGG